MRTLDDHNDAVNAVIECAGRMASGSDDGTIKLWNTKTWQCEVGYFGKSLHLMHPTDELGWRVSKLW